MVKNRCRSLLSKMQHVPSSACNTESGGRQKHRQRNTVAVFSSVFLEPALVTLRAVACKSGRDFGGVGLLLKGCNPVIATFVVECFPYLPVAGVGVVQCAFDRVHLPGEE